MESRDDSASIGKRVHIKLMEWAKDVSAVGRLSRKQKTLCEFLLRLTDSTYAPGQKLTVPVEETRKQKRIKIQCASQFLFSDNSDLNTFLTIKFLAEKKVGSLVRSDTLFHQLLSDYLLTTDIFANYIQTVFLLLCKIEAKYKITSVRAASLSEVGKALIEQQAKLLENDNRIWNRFQYFIEEEGISRQLLSHVQCSFSDNIFDSFKTIDDCLLFLANNQHIKDGRKYTALYTNLFSKAADIVRIYVSSVITEASECAISSKIDCNLGQDEAFALYYGKFQLAAAKIKRISKFVEERVHFNKKYEALLLEMHNCYFAQRTNIILVAIQKSISEITSNNRKDYCTLNRSICTLLFHVCQDEYRLFVNFFSSGVSGLNTYLERICTILNDTLRPYIIHLNHLETLAEICNILKTEMLEEHVNTESAGSLEAFGHAISQLLQDCQERLVFRTHLYVQSDILNYNPAKGDLAYPEKLLMIQNITLSTPMIYESALEFTKKESNINQEMDGHAESKMISIHASDSPVDLHAMWYPTLRRTLVCLSRLYRCVDRSVFHGISQEAIRSCILSISKAAQLILKNKSPMDGMLFEIKHLLILREQMAPFRTDFTVKETTLDFSKAKTAAIELLQKRNHIFSLSSNSLLEFLLQGTPQVKEHLVDSRKIVDKQLKMICEQFVSYTVYTFLGPIIDFLEKEQIFGVDDVKFDGLKSLRTSPSIKTGTRADPRQINTYIRQSLDAIKQNVTFLHRSLSLYINNKETEFIIFRMIRNNIINTYSSLEHALKKNAYTSQEMIIIGCPSIEHVSLLLCSAGEFDELVKTEVI